MEQLPFTLQHRIAEITTHEGKKQIGATLFKCGPGYALKSKGIRILVDLSGSMRYDLYKVKASLKTFLDLLVSSYMASLAKNTADFDRLDESEPTEIDNNAVLYDAFDIQIVTFSDEAELLVNTKNPLYKPNIYDLISTMECNGSTNIGDALKMAVQSCQDARSCYWTLIFTDGMNNMGSLQSHDAFAAYVQEIPNNIKISACGFGDSHDAKLLRILGDYIYLTKKDQYAIPATFSGIADEFMSTFGFSTVLTCPIYDKLVYGTNQVGLLYEGREFLILWDPITPLPDTVLVRYYDISTNTPVSVQVPLAVSDTITDDQITLGWYQQRKLEYLRQIENGKLMKSENAAIKEDVGKWPVAAHGLRDEILELLKHANDVDVTMHCYSMQSECTRQTAYAATTSLCTPSSNMSKQRMENVTQGITQFSKYVTSPF